MSTFKINKPDRYKMQHSGSVKEKVELTRVSVFQLSFVV